MRGSSFILLFSWTELFNCSLDFLAVVRVSISSLWEEAPRSFSEVAIVSLPILIFKPFSDMKFATQWSFKIGMSGSDFSDTFSVSFFVFSLSSFLFLLNPRIVYSKNCCNQGLFIPRFVVSKDCCINESLNLRIVEFQIDESKDGWIKGNFNSILLNPRVDEYEIIKSKCCWIQGCFITQVKQNYPGGLVIMIIWVNAQTLLFWSQ